MPNRYSAPRIRSVPWICSSKIRSTPGLGQQAHARASPLPAMIDWTSGHRPGVAVAVGRRDLGPAPPGVAGVGGVQQRVGHRPDDQLGGLECLEVDRRRRDDDRHPLVLRLGEADVEVGAERAPPPRRRTRSRWCPGDPADDLTDQVALGDGVVPRRRARLPPRLLGGQQRGALLPVGQVLGFHRLGPARAVRRCGPSGGGPRWPLAAGGELRPVAGDGCVEVELAPVGQHQGAEEGHGLGGGPHVGDGVLLPRRADRPRRRCRPRCPPPARRAGARPPRRPRRCRRRGSPPASSATPSNCGSQVPWMSAIGRSSSGALRVPRSGPSRSVPRADRRGPPGSRTVVPDRDRPDGPPGTAVPADRPEPLAW